MSRAISLGFLNEPRWTQFSEPHLKFRVSKHSPIQFPIEGIQQIGPYDYNARTRPFQSIHVQVLIDEESVDIERMQTVFKILVNGSGYYGGMREEFNLEKDPSVKWTSVETADASPAEAWLKALQDLRGFSLEHSKKGERTVVIVGGEDYKAFSNTSHYYTVKRELLKQGVPNQYLSGYAGDSGTGILGQDSSNQSFIYSIWNVALALYAKAGGQPWVLKNPSLGRGNVDCVAGLRFAVDRSKGGKGFVIGALSVFGLHGTLYGIRAERFVDSTTDGRRWTARSRGAYVDENDANTLARIIMDRYHEKTGASPQHIVIHRLGPFDKREIRGLTSSLEEAGVDQYCLLEVYSQWNPRGFEDKDGKPRAVRRGLGIVLSSNSALVCTTGDSYYQFLGKEQCRPHYMGTPRPIVVRIREGKNSFTDPLEAAQNVFALTALHWGCGWSKEVQLPVTLSFAQKVAKLYANGVLPHQCLDNTAWFL